MGRASMAFVASNEPLSLLETAPRAIEMIGDDLARVGVHSKEDIAAALVLDNQAARQFSSESQLISDDHNLLAWAASRVGEDWALKQPIAEAIAPYDVLPDIPDDFDTDLLARRLAQRKALPRAKSLIDTLAEPAKSSALGWVALDNGRTHAAIQRFQRALKQDPNHAGAAAGLALADPARANLENLPPETRVLLTGRSFLIENDWLALLELDELLATWPPGSLLYPEAARLRITWRLIEGTPSRAEEALAIANELVTRSSRVEDLLLRAEAAGRSGLDNHAWSTLERIRRLIQGRPNSAAITERAVGISFLLDDIEGAKDTLEGLKAIREGTKGPR